jgi:hypothetical protein
MLKEQRRRFEAEMALMDLQSNQTEEELSKLTDDLNRATFAGHQSEPTTPPDHSEQGFPSFMSRPRLPQSMASPPGFQNRNSRSGSILHTPPSEAAYGSTITGNGSNINSQSVPGSRRGSNENENGQPKVQQTPAPNRGVK